MNCFNLFTSKPTNCITLVENTPFVIEDLSDKMLKFGDIRVFVTEILMTDDFAYI